MLLCACMYLNSWTALKLLLPWDCYVKPAGSAVPHLSGDVAKLAFPKLWTSLEVTFLYEHHLLELRHIAFEGKSHLRESSFCVSELPCTVTGCRAQRLTL